MDQIIAVDTDIAVHARESAAWAQYGVDILRVDAMHEAITRLARGEVYLFVAINEDTIDYAGQLPLLRDMTDTPIFVITSHYTTDKKTHALSLGADVYDPFAEISVQNIRGALELLKLQNKWANRPRQPMPLLIGGNIVLSPSRRKVFVKDTEVTLTKKEFELLRHLMANQGRFLSSAQLLCEVWDDEYHENGNNVLWQAISRLRYKLSEVSPEAEYIKAEREVGYIFLA